MTTIYHNPRCSKSRQTLQILEEKGETIEIVHYLKNVPSKAELKNVLELLNIEPMALIRKGEAVWKEQFKNKSFTDEELIEIMHTYPKLIERPIVIKGTKAVIGRPPEKVLEIL